MATYQILELEVIRWAEQKGIIPNSTPEIQLLKAMSEMGELADATIKKDRAKIVDGAGDVIICMINYCALQDINLVDCLELAYNEVKHRKGTLMPNGLFVKEEK